MAESVPETLRWEIWARDNFTCRCCGSRLFLVIDHIHPVSKGGQTMAQNLQTLCSGCNTRKRDHSRMLRPNESCVDPDCDHAPYGSPVQRRGDATLSELVKLPIDR